jgi:hypothetical protein
MNPLIHKAGLTITDNNLKKHSKKIIQVTSDRRIFSSFFKRILNILVIQVCMIACC